METWKRICIQEFTLTDKIGQVLELKRGAEYLTGREENGQVMVFTKFWVDVPARLFAGEVRFT